METSLNDGRRRQFSFFSQNVLVRQSVRRRRQQQHPRQRQQRQRRLRRRRQLLEAARSNGMIQMTPVRKIAPGQICAVSKTT